MEYRRFGNKIAARIDRGDELCACVLDICREENIGLASVTAIGASDDVTLGVFNTRTKEYFKRRYNERNYEISSAVGNLSRMAGEPYLHMHAVIGCPETEECHGGHLNAAVISATAEVFIDILEGEAGRKFSDEIGLNLFEF